MCLLLLGTFLSTDAQVVFKKFKFIKDQPTFPTKAQGRRALDLTFYLEEGRQLKYVKIVYAGVNQVGDAICSDIYGAVNANTPFTLYKSLEIMGPFGYGKKKNGTWHRACFYSKLKDITAFPVRLELTYTDQKEPVVIPITKENIGQFFPTVPWMEVDYEHNAPSTE